MYIYTRYAKWAGGSACVFITAGPSPKLFAWGGGDIGGHVLRETTSRGLCGLVCPSRTCERVREGDCVGTRVEPGTLTLCSVHSILL